MRTKDYTHHIAGPFFVLLFVTQGIKSETFGVPFLDAIIASLLIYHGVRFFTGGLMRGAKVGQINSLN